LDESVERTPFEQYLFEQEDAKYGTTGSQNSIDDIMVCRVDGGKPNAEHDDSEYKT
jgi:hypothetical protein